MKTILVIFGILVFCASSFAFEQKDINDLKKLSDFETVEQFEVYYEDYIQTCLDNGYGGTDSIPCFIAYELWDRELNIYYQKLYKILNDNQKKELKKSQLKWLEARDLIINFNSIMLDNYYQDKEGTMYILIRARDADETIHRLVKERALFLKSWFVQKSEPIEK